MTPNQKTSSRPSRSSRRSNRPSRTGRYAGKKTTRKLQPPLPEEIFDFGKATETGIVFWCQECKEEINPEKDKKGKFVCPKCRESRIIWGTKKSVQNYTAHQKNHPSR